MSTSSIKAAIPERSNLGNCPSSSPWVPRPSHMEEESIPSPANALNSDGAECLKRLRQLEWSKLAWRTNREERCRERELQRSTESPSPHKYLAKYWSVQTGENNTRAQGKNSNYPSKQKFGKLNLLKLGHRFGEYIHST